MARKPFLPLLESAANMPLNRRTVMGGLAMLAGGVLTSCGAQTVGEKTTRRGRVLMEQGKGTPVGLATALEFPLIEALLGRRARRFSMGAEIPDGPLQYKSDKEPMPLNELEQMMVLAAATGNTGYHYMITRHARYKPHLSNYSLSAGGRTFPSAAGFHTTNFFYTDDKGLYYLPTRDVPDLKQADAENNVDLNGWLQRHKSRIKKIRDGRLFLPAEEPYLEGHNTWSVNRPGSTLLIPVADVAQHMIGVLAFLGQNGYCIFDDINNQKIKGLEKFSKIVNVDSPYPLSFVEQYTLAEVCAELSTSCYAGMLMLQAMGLGGWMFDGIDRFSILGASGNPEVPALGFRFDTNNKWSTPNPTGLADVFEAFCPPHVPNMRAAVDKLIERKYGPGGPFNAETPGPWKESGKIRSSAEVHSEEFKECIALQAQYIFDKFGKFPGTVPSVMTLMYLQAHHLDLAFYDKYFKPGAYLQTHAEHMKNWHDGHDH
jgi:hypothetical protein